MKTKKEIRQSWKEKIEEAFLYANGHATRKEKQEYIEGLAGLIKELQPGMPKYSKVAEVLERRAPDLALLAHEIHAQDTEASLKSRMKSVMYLRNKGYEIKPLEKKVYINSDK